MNDNSIIIGLTGPFGSGCTYIAKNFIEKMGYKYLSLSDILRTEFKKDNNDSDIKIRNNLQEYGNDIRKTKGNDYLAKMASQIIKSDESQKNGSLIVLEIPMKLNI